MLLHESPIRLSISYRSLLTSTTRLDSLELGGVGGLCLADWRVHGLGDAVRRAVYQGCTLYTTVLAGESKTITYPLLPPSPNVENLSMSIPRYVHRNALIVLPKS